MIAVESVGAGAVEIQMSVVSRRPRGHRIYKPPRLFQSHDTLPYSSSSSTTTMKRFRELVDLKKDKQQRLAVDGTTNGSATTTPAGPKMLATPSSSDQYRYRRFEGVNVSLQSLFSQSYPTCSSHMGSWFVNEEWICQSVFQSAASPKQSDLDICKGSSTS